MLVLVLAIALSPVAVPRVKAQETSITSLQAPSKATAGTNVTVVVAATYDLGPNGFAVSIGILDRDSSLPWATGTAQSSKNTCHIFTNQALCAYIPKSATGSDVVTFNLQFSQGKTYRLSAAVELYYSNATLIQSANTFRDFSIVVSATSPQRQTTQVLSVNYYPANVISGDTVFIIAIVSYSGGSWLWANLIDLSSTQPVAATVTSTPSCTRSNGSVCGILTNGGSGNVTFTWSFLILVAYSGTVLYDVQTFLTDSSPTPVTYNESISHYHVPIHVAIQSPTSSETQTPPQVYPTYSILTSPPQSASQAADNTPLVVVVVAAVLVGLFLFSRRRKKVKKPESREATHHNNKHSMSSR